MDIHIIRWGIHITKDYPKTNQLNMLLTCYEGINHIWTARNMEKSGKDRNAACFVKPVMTSLFGYSGRNSSDDH